ncbi:MAG TPA: biotin/lipoyl-containing protein [Holophagaceae bacterium]|nr:biotin/lipoyl-containing protein [Holophagaceae bacterium]
MKRTLILGKEQIDVELVRQDGVVTLTWNGETHVVDLLEVESGCWSVILEGRSIDVRLDAGRHPDPDIHAYRATLYDGAYDFALQDPRKALLAAAGGAAAAGGTLTAPMPGKVVKVLVKEGETVAEGQTLLILEAMKMQNEYKSPAAGTVAKLHVGEGSTVETATPMVDLKAQDAK